MYHPAEANLSMQKLQLTHFNATKRRKTKCKTGFFLFNIVLPGRRILSLLSHIFLNWRSQLSAVMHLKMVVPALVLNTCEALVSAEHQFNLYSSFWVIHKPKEC